MSTNKTLKYANGATVMAGDWIEIEGVSTAIYLAVGDKFMGDGGGEAVGLIFFWKHSRLPGYCWVPNDAKMKMFKIGALGG